MGVRLSTELWDLYFPISLFLRYTIYVITAEIECEHTRVAQLKKKQELGWRCGDSSLGCMRYR